MQQTNDKEKAIKQMQCLWSLTLSSLEALSGSSLPSLCNGSLDSERPLRAATFRGPIFFTSDLAPFFMPWFDNKDRGDSEEKLCLSLGKKEWIAEKGGTAQAHLVFSGTMLPVRFFEAALLHSFKLQVCQSEPICVICGYG